MPRVLPGTATIAAAEGMQPTRFDAPRLVRRTVVEFRALSLPEDVRLALAEAFWAHFGIRSERSIHTHWFNIKTFDQFASESGAIGGLADLHCGLLVRYVECDEGPQDQTGSPADPLVLHRAGRKQRLSAVGAAKARAEGCGDIYPHQEESHVRAYEWCAELREQVSSEWPDAVAYGMAYRFDRKEGLPGGGKWDLMTAADGLADVDLLQVNAFLEQHDDAEALIDEGDLAFVWLWERRSAVRAGAGRACLLTALSDLCRRLRNIRTVVVDLKPYQYVVTDGAGMPTAVHIEKLEALDRLQTFVDGLRLGEIAKGHCRYIVNREEDDPDAAMRVLGLAGLAQQQ
jgi:hypothetical protein